MSRQSKAADEAATVFYCYVRPGRMGERSGTVMHVNSLKTVGLDVPIHEARTVEDFERLITEHSVDSVMFYFFGFPRRAVAREKSAPHFRRLVRQHSK
ncbi:MAG TPA: hypothetical protein VF507_02735 [Pyrinomonadaceae bacterium]